MNTDYKKRMLNLLKTEAVLFISGTAALITVFFVPLSREYFSYLDLRVLALLFCLMTVVAGFNSTGVFLRMSQRLLKKASNTRSLGFVLVLLCYFTSMWITNDVALITFVPFAILVLNIAGQSKYIIQVVVLETIAANLGSMLTPVGNPQNLYLFTFYNIPILDFLKITLPYTILSLALLIIAILLMQKEPLHFSMPEAIDAATGNTKKLLMYGCLFLLCLACVVRLIDYKIMLSAALAVILLFDRKILKAVDYSLLMTFVFFFIFVGNMGNIPVVREFLLELLKGKELGVSIAVSQVISNVPSAVLLSAFTDQYKALILGTDIGGLGTLVASLASLISYKFYCRTANSKPGKYLGVFTVYNLLFLAGLCLFHFIA